MRVQLIVVILLIGFVWALATKEGMAVSPKARELCAATEKFFGKAQGEPQTREYLRAVPGGDPVQFERMRDLHRKKLLNPEAVQRMLNQG